MSDKTIQNTTVGTVQPGALTAIARKEDFLQHLQDFLDTHKTEKWCVAAIDVEHFRLYNELYGTEQGNTLLNTLASHLLDYQKTSGCPVGYWGNDDFFLCLPDDRVQQQDIVITLQTCVSPNHQDVTFFLALGLCPVSEHPEADAATLCNYAQIAVMNPDHSGSGIHRFAPAMLDSLKAQQQLLSELEHALDNHEFTFFLQPKCNSMTRAIVGMEALVRWNHPTRGCVQPSEFMPLLESTGLISRLDQYIWEAVCQTLQKWQASGSNLVPVSVNVSVVDIVNLDVPQIFSDLVEKYQLEPKLLLAEITETMLAENSSVVENAIQGLHRKGFSVMMDDFGSGYSSLNMLKDTNVDAIKLDMKLIDMNQQNHSKGVQIVESVINMAHRLNLPIIAEGVETPEQVSMLQAADCLYTQGYYFFKPMPVENAEKLLAQPNNADYWDIRRDLMRRDHRTATEDPDSEKTALALQAYQIFTDNLLEVSLLNLVTGTYRVIKRDARLPGADLAKEEDFTTFCDRLVNEKVVHPDDAEMFQEQVDLPLLQDTLFHSQQPEFYRFRKQIANQFVWITMEVLPCRGCCAQNPWATVLMREDAQANQLSEELDFSYSHDTLTGLANRSKYESDLRELQYSDYDSMVCTYIDVVGLHEVNDHLGHRSGDNLLCTIANAARKFFVSSRIYRVGGDEFVVLTPQPAALRRMDRLRPDARVPAGEGLRDLGGHPEHQQSAQAGSGREQGRAGHAAGQAGLLRPQRAGASAQGPERKAGAHPDPEAGRRALPAGAGPQVPQRVCGEPAGRQRAAHHHSGLLPEDPGHLRRLLPCRHHRLPRPVCGAGIPRRLQQRAGLQLCAQQGAERRDRGGALHQNRRCTLHPQDHPVFLQRLSHPRDHLDLCR